MRNFDKKVKYLDSLFIYRFRVSEYKEHRLKIYYISPDNTHIYVAIDSIPNENGEYTLEVGDLFFDQNKKKTFEDSPSEVFSLGFDDFKIFRGIYDKTKNWSNQKIKEIISFTDKKDYLDLVI